MGHFVTRRETERKEGDALMEDEKIIELFFARSETAIRELDSKYGKVCYSISYNILNNNLDAEECVNDAYLGTWNAIPPQRPNPLLAFVCKIVRRYSIMRHRANTAMKRNGAYDVALEELEHCLADPGRWKKLLKRKRWPGSLKVSLIPFRKKTG